MQRRRYARIFGFTLMEVMMATAIFAVVVGVTATSLTSFYVTLDIQGQRIEAINSCRAVMGSIREKRDEFYDAATDVYNWTQFANWIAAENEDGWDGYLSNDLGGAALDGQTLAVELCNEEGLPAAIGIDNPLEIHVMTGWFDREGHQLNSQLVSILSSR